MKFLLVGINAKYIHSNPAIYSLKAYAGEQFAKSIELDLIYFLTGSDEEDDEDDDC